jgi:hypothetical protein
LQQHSFHWNLTPQRVFNIIGPRPLGRANLKDFEVNE